MKYLAAGAVCVLIFVAGFFLGQMIAGTAGVTGTFAPGANTANVQESRSGDAVDVDTSQMTDGQRQMLRAMGIDPNSVTITPEMVACAEAKVGAARVEEFKNGATPSFSEGAMLLACYQSS